ncbi:MAG: hypothetical protein CMG66_01780 [Candidatus Marinimicrobia bacterium]|nr:hypothetical protein [Candidatus Neomarinimicrobiota bacterium]|tara:strand:- start:112 stop:375 length:264 start_codon:yes stop_codon:yes gene_type:complete
MFKKIKTTLQQFIEKEDSIDYLEFKKIEKKWKEKISKQIQSNAKVVDFINGDLFIKVKKTTWKNELVFMQTELKKNFQTNKTQLKKL